VTSFLKFNAASVEVKLKSAKGGGYTQFQDVHESIDIFPCSRNFTVTFFYPRVQPFQSLSHQHQNSLKMAINLVGILFFQVHFHAVAMLKTLNISCHPVPDCS